jgi:hypothetical protein
LTRFAIFQVSTRVRARGRRGYLFIGNEFPCCQHLNVANILPVRARDSAVSGVTQQVLVLEDVMTARSIAFVLPRGEPQGHGHKFIWLKIACQFLLLSPSKK